MLKLAHPTDAKFMTGLNLAVFKPTTHKVAVIWGCVNGFLLFLKENCIAVANLVMAIDKDAYHENTRFVSRLHKY